MAFSEKKKDQPASGIKKTNKSNRKTMMLYSIALFSSLGMVHCYEPITSVTSISTLLTSNSIDVDADHQSVMEKNVINLDGGFALSFPPKPYEPPPFPDIVIEVGIPDLIGDISNGPVEPRPTNNPLPQPGAGPGAGAAAEGGRTGNASPKMGLSSPGAQHLALFVAIFYGIFM